MTESSLSTQDIQPLIHTIRGQRMILAGDLAMLYGVETRHLNQQIKRNSSRFPTDFMFQLTTNETEAHARSRSQIVILKKGQNVLAANETILKRLAEIDKTLLQHNAALRDIYQKLMPLLQPPSEQPRPKIGFQEPKARYGLSRRR